ncbi:hypothetical protein KC344_g146 [Hortaea werneckii]|nr:hypothetical protein KC344_g146 [Hortaea werneckii]
MSRRSSVWQSSKHRTVSATFRCHVLHRGAGWLMSGHSRSIRATANLEKRGIHHIIEHQSIKAGCQAALNVDWRLFTLA